MPAQIGSIDLSTPCPESNPQCKTPFDPSSFRSDQQDILNLTKWFGSQNAGPVSLGVHFSGSSENPPGGFYIPAAQILNEATRQTGFLSRVFGNFKDSVISSANFIGGALTHLADGVIDLGLEMRTNGAIPTLNKYAAQIFDRKTLETIAANGLDSLWNSNTQRMNLPDGTKATAHQLSSTTTILIDDNDHFVGQIQEGSLEVGRFGIAQNGEYFLKDGTFDQGFSDGYHLTSSMIEGRIQSLDITAPDHQPLIHIKSRDGIQMVFDKTGEIVDGVIDVLNGAFRFTIENGLVTDIFSGTAYAAIPLGGELVPISPLNLPNGIAIDHSTTDELKNGTEWLATFMNQGRFNASVAQQIISPNEKNEVYGTNYFDPVFDTDKQIADKLQLGDDVTKKIDVKKGEWFFVYNTENLTYSRIDNIIRQYTGTADSLPSVPDRSPTGRTQFVINGPIALSGNTIYAGHNDIFNRIRAWLAIKFSGRRNVSP